MFVRNLKIVLDNATNIEKRFLSTKTGKYEVKNNLQEEAFDKDICLLVDENDNLIGTATKRECHKISPHGKLLLHRAFSVIMFNKNGDILLHKRANQKITYSNQLTTACCSHPLYIKNKPENIIMAARRRLNYELGIPYDQMDPELFKFVNRYQYFDGGDGVWGEHELVHVVILQGNMKIEPNPDEISEYFFIPKSEYDKFLSTTKTPLTPWFSLMSRLLLKHWWDNLHRLPEIAETDKIYRF